MLELYGIDKTFYLLNILTFSCYELIESMVSQPGCCVVYCSDNTVRGEPMSVRMIFMAESIKYIFEGVTHAQVHLPTVEYIYYLMSLMDASWMSRVVQTVRPAMQLSTSCKIALGRMGDSESMMRRFLAPNLTVFKEVLRTGRGLSAEKYAEYFTDKLEGKSTIFEMDLFPNFKGDRETIYMHDFFLFGRFSNHMNLHSLHHLLLTEAILSGQHVWQEIFCDTYHCQIEMFHMIISRYRWASNTNYFIFIKKELANLTLLPQMPKFSSNIVNCDRGLDRMQLGWKQEFNRHMIQHHFFSAKHPLRVKQLRHLAEMRVSTNLFVKRVDIVSELTQSPAYVTE